MEVCSARLGLREAMISLTVGHIVDTECVFDDDWRVDDRYELVATYDKSLI
jgi:hypothetical protein